MSAEIAVLTQIWELPRYVKQRSILDGKVDRGQEEMVRDRVRSGEERGDGARRGGLDTQGRSSFGHTRQKA